MSNWDIVEPANEFAKEYVLVLENGWSAVVCENTEGFEPTGTWGFTIFDASDNVDYVTGVYDLIAYDTAEDAMFAAEWRLSNIED